MRVLLQNTETKLYFIDSDQWTQDPSEATDFEEIQLAEQVYHHHDLAYARIVVEPGPSPAAEVPDLQLKYAPAHG